MEGDQKRMAPLFVRSRHEGSMMPESRMTYSCRKRRSVSGGFKMSSQTAHTLRSISMADSISYENDFWNRIFSSTLTTLKRPECSIIMEPGIKSLSISNATPSRMNSVHPPMMIVGNSMVTHSPLACAAAMCSIPLRAAVCTTGSVWLRRKIST